MEKIKDLDKKLDLVNSFIQDYGKILTLLRKSEDRLDEYIGKPPVKECEHLNCLVDHRGKPCNCDMSKYCSECKEPTDKSEKIEEIIRRLYLEESSHYGRYQKEILFMNNIESWLRDKLKEL